MKYSFKPLFKVLIDREIKEKTLAEKAGISTATLCKMKKDNAVININVIVKICVALNCSVNDILIISAAGADNSRKGLVSPEGVNYGT